jgi:hypothetical protein
MFIYAHTNTNITQRHTNSNTNTNTRHAGLLTEEFDRSVMGVMLEFISRLKRAPVGVEYTAPAAGPMHFICTLKAKFVNHSLFARKFGVAALGHFNRLVDRLAAAPTALELSRIQLSSGYPADSALSSNNPDAPADLARGRGGANHSSSKQ